MQELNWQLVISIGKGLTKVVDCVEKSCDEIGHTLLESIEGEL